MSAITKAKARPAPFTVGVALDGAGFHPAAWREPGARPAALFTAAYWSDLLRLAETAGLDYATLEDSLTIPGVGIGAGSDGSAAEHALDHAAASAGPDASSAGADALPPRPASGRVPGRLDALLVASWAAPRTSRIGIIPTVTVTHTEPFHVATALQTLDHVSLGRAGWQLRISADAASAAAFGRREAPAVDPDRVIAGEPDAALDELLAEAGDAAEVARRLWDSWEDGAIIRDVATGRFLDRGQVHHIDFAGERFSVAGPSIVPRSPQGQLPVTLLAHSPAVYALAARVADVVFVTPGADTARAGAARGKSAEEIVAEVRREEDLVDRERAGLAPLRIVADIVVALDGAGAAAAGGRGGVPAETAAERVARLDALAGEPFGSDAALVAGSAEEVADAIASLRAAGIEGVRLRPLALPGDLEAIGDRLVPILVERGILPADREAESLRERFRLGEAENRYAAERAADRLPGQSDTPKHASETKEVAV